LDIAPKSNTVTVGPAELLDIFEVTGDRPVWSAGDPPAATFDCLAQLRAHGTPIPATAQVEPGRLRVRLHRPARGVAPGQAVVVYDGDAVLGSATITATDRR
jgi:Predicted tRNA(5-methylaminomethyl-2-thiouridylate) methyltransferase, contains the PP-loop ATPase domain